MDKQTLNKMLQYVDQREIRLDATPESIEHWLWNETYERRPTHSIITDFKSFPPDRFDSTHRVRLGVDLATQYPDGKCVRIRDAIHFAMLQLSTQPPRTRINSRCRALPEALAYFDDLWTRLLEAFSAAPDQVFDP